MFLSEIKIDWNKTVGVWKLLTHKLGCGRKEWTTLSPFVFNLTKGEKLYGMVKVSLDHWVFPPTQKNLPLYIVFRVGEGRIFPPLCLDVNVERKTFKVNGNDEILISVNGVDGYLRRVSDVHWERTTIPHDLSRFTEFPKFDGRKLRRAVKLFGDCDLFTSKVEGKGYTVLSDGSRHLVLEGLVTETQITYLPLFKRFIDDWRYIVTVGEHFYFIEVSDEVYLACPRWKRNIVPDIFKTLHELKGKSTEIFLPVRDYKKLVRGVLREGMMVGRLNGKLNLRVDDGKFSLEVRLLNKLTDEILLSVVTVKLKGNDNTERVGVELPAVHILNWDKLINLQRKWYEFVFIPSRFKVILPTEVKSDEWEKGLPVVVGNERGKFPCLILEESGVGEVDFYSTLPLK